MSIEMLAKLAEQPLPRFFLEQEDIDRVLLCQAAGYVDAYVPPPSKDAGPAKVMRIKPEGHRALAIYYREKIRESGFGDLS
ncbi:hypothetical protein RD110_07960 [Rhodoferax koreense]|uniref:Uncharacterized protein n=1 Tax=Rhodoferax koreensis TaxID=1842727 RepID=A0A1P8JTT8_9BURK|nr:hypothetical protein [Rhodoferax koreense]APW37138.1 hypothetical protein RD110_07960 [Rhodoferax koreense]